MYLKWIFIVLIFLAGLYTSLNYSSHQFKEGFGGPTRCPDMLIQDGEELILKNSMLADIPGVNPVRFKNLEEYAEFVQWQKSQGINCPVLYYTKTYDAQSHEGYLPTPLPPIPMDGSPLNLNPFTDKPPFGSLTYPRLDTHNQDIGAPTKLNEYYNVGETDPLSANAVDTNWGGTTFSSRAVDQGHYVGNYVTEIDKSTKHQPTQQTVFQQSTVSNPQTAERKTASEQN